MHYRFALLTWLLSGCFFWNLTALNAQDNLYIAGNGSNGGIVLGQFNVSTCTFCPEMEIPVSLFNSGTSDVIPLPNGRIVVVGGDDIYVFDPPNNTPISALDLPGNTYVLGGVLAPNGNVYLSVSEFIGSDVVSRLYEFNPNTNTLTLVGSFPANTYQMSEIFFWNGQLYSFVTNYTNDPFDFALASIQIGNPLTATILYSYPALCGAPTATINSGPNAGIYTGALDPFCSGSDLLSFDLPNNSTGFQCLVDPSGFPYGMGSVPPGFPPPPANCLCNTDAGTITAQPLTNYCVDETIPVPHNGDETLDNNDLLQYVLFSNPADTSGSIIATSNTPEFNFAAPMQTGVTYYVAAVAGNNTGGNVDLNDPCLDFSNANPIRWRPLPTVTFSVANPEVCAGGCTTVTATFTGTAPFTLTYTTPAGATTQTFSGNTGTFQICTTANAPPGSFLIQATALADAWCVCND